MNRYDITERFNQDAIMTFSELVRLLKNQGFSLMKEKGSIRYYRKVGHDKLIRVDYHGKKEVPTGNLSCHSEGHRTSYSKG